MAEKTVRSDSISTGDMSTMRTITEIKTPASYSASPTVLTSSTVAQEILNEAFSASAAVSANSPKPTPGTDWDLEEKRIKRLEEYNKKKESIRKKYEKDVDKLTAKYREKIEAEAEKIRK